MGDMTVFLASYPRSGNTFFRVVAHSLFGVRSADVYDPEAVIREDDGEREVIKLMGHSRAAEAALLKTHDPADADDPRPAICVVRDGRDVYVSYMHFAMRYFPDQMPPGGFVEVLRMLVASRDHFGGWSANVESWLGRRRPPVVVRYEDLIAKPEDSVREACRAAGVDLPGAGGAGVPDFESLRALLPGVFRKGKTGAWREEMPAEIEALFWEHHGVMMDRLEYPR